MLKYFTWVSLYDVTYSLHFILGRSKGGFRASYLGRHAMVIFFNQNAYMPGTREIKQMGCGQPICRGLAPALIISHILSPQMCPAMKALLSNSKHEMFPKFALNIRNFSLWLRKSSKLLEVFIQFYLCLQLQTSNSQKQSLKNS